ncbi:MAG: CooT family nickel-binding protein [Candidatus Faecousia sp.]|nr:CooT family nickel-binding protein [Candidatus Faecousia sp.]
MCLSTVYKNSLKPEAILMKNVMRIECKDDMVILTDLMERQVAIEGTLEMANLVDGVAVVREAVTQ